MTGYAWVRMLFCPRNYDVSTYGVVGANWQKNLMELVYRVAIDQDKSHFAPGASQERRAVRWPKTPLF